jgi:hypothetical protein
VAVKEDQLSFFIVGVLIVLTFVIGATFGCVRYRECRAHGFSRFYCATQK